MTEDEFQTLADNLLEAEHALITKFDAYDGSFRALVAQYDTALANGDKAGLAAYYVAVEELRAKQIETKRVLDDVRTEYDLLERYRPRREQTKQGKMGGIARLWRLLS
jgi:hypothetical protein